MIVQPGKAARSTDTPDLYERRTAMPGRVTRKNNRRRNSGAICVHDWLICGDRVPGDCPDLRHEKEFGRLLAEFRLFGPWDGVRVLDGCGCEFVAVPVCAL
jgi:hypothetical protein